jgi:hypothetical protein
MKPLIFRKSLFIALFFSLFLIWIYVTKANMPLSDLGIDSFSMAAYVFALAWMAYSYKNIQDKQRYFCFIFQNRSLHRNWNFF